MCKYLAKFPEFLTQVVCVGSMAELEELSGVKVTDLHRERWVRDSSLAIRNRRADIKKNWVFFA